MVQKYVNTLSGMIEVNDGNAYALYPKYVREEDYEKRCEELEREKAELRAKCRIYADESLELAKHNALLRKRREELLLKMQQLEREEDGLRKDCLDGLRKDCLDWIALCDRKEADNALLRKRLEPIEEVYKKWGKEGRTLDEIKSMARFLSLPLDIFLDAIHRCMELKEGE